MLGGGEDGKKQTHNRVEAEIIKFGFELLQCLRSSNFIDLVGAIKANNLLHKKKMLKSNLFNIFFFELLNDYRL